MKKAVLAVLVLFLVFWLFTDPRGMADTTHSLFLTISDWGSQLFRSVIKFVGALN